MMPIYRCAVVLACWIMAGGGTFVLAGEGDAAKGKPIFEATCVPCHGPQGKGDGPLGLLLKPPAANFTSPESKKKSPAELLDTIQNGRPGTGMVAWKNQYSAEQMQDLLAYVLTLRK